MFDLDWMTSEFEIAATPERKKIEVFNVKFY